MKREQFIQELIAALSQTSPLPEPEEFPELAEGEIVVGEASPPVQALVHLYIQLEKSVETATEDTAESVFANAAATLGLAMALASLERENQELPVSGFAKGWKLAHDPNDFISVFR